jgi:L-2-hydroxyglutarate oxidase LhgO
MLLSVKGAHLCLVANDSYCALLEHYYERLVHQYCFGLQILTIILVEDSCS